MQLIVLSSAAILVTASPGAETSRRLEIKPSPDGRVELFVGKTGLLSGKTHHFVFEAYEGLVDLDPAAPAISTVQLRITSRSIVCRDTWVSSSDIRKIEKVALNDMLAADRYPEIRFRSVRIEQLNPAVYRIDGEVTIRDVTRPVVMSVERTGEDLYAGEAKLKLTDFKLKPPSAALGLIGTKDEMLLRFSLHAKAAGKGTPE
jgi:polyisoprenoid-binding protein YceI